MTAPITDADRAAAHALYVAYIEPDDCEHGEDDDMCTAIAQAIADAREAENKCCEIAVLGNSCDTNSNCRHNTCHITHRLARAIAARRSR